MSVIGPRGRHRAPSKVQTQFNSAARVTATIAVSGGLVAAVAGQQAAHAEGVAAISPTAQKSAETTVSAAGAKTVVPTSEHSTTSVVDLKVRGVVSKPKPKPKPKPQPAETTQQEQQTQAAETTRQEQPTTSRSQQRPDPSPTKQETPKQDEPTAPSDPAPSTGTAHSSALAVAKKYIGTPYVYGGESPSGFDCSGFTMYVFAQIGVTIPRTASAQQSAVTPVSDPQPGDLVFFGSPAYHVGIYAGNGMMIDSPKPGKTVQVHKIWDTPSGYGRP